MNEPYGEGTTLIARGVVEDRAGVLVTVVSCGAKRVRIRVRALHGPPLFQYFRRDSWQPSNWRPSYGRGARDSGHEKSFTLRRGRAFRVGGVTYTMTGGSRAGAQIEVDHSGGEPRSAAVVVGQADIIDEPTMEAPPAAAPTHDQASAEPDAAATPREPPQESRSGWWPFS